ncbi:MAG: CHAT domain-containing protein [Coleofasciculaceae cyanobacterium]
MISTWFKSFLKLKKIFSDKHILKYNKNKIKIITVYAFLFSFAFLFTTFCQIPLAHSTTPTVSQTSANPQSLVQQGKELYDAGEFAAAAKILQQAADGFKAQGDQLRQAISLSNLSLAYQKLGKWSEAQEAIATSLQLLENANTTEQLKIRGAAFDIEGQLHLAQGQADLARESFIAAANSYQKAGDETGVIRSQINQAGAEQASGMYRRSLDTLQEIRETMQPQADSALKATALRSLGRTLRLVGDLERSREVLLQSLAIAQALTSPPDISATLLSLGNTAKAQGEKQAALEYYRRASDTAANLPSTKIKAQLNQLSLLAENPQRSTQNQTLLGQIQSQLDQLPPSRNSVDARINLARSMMQLGNRGNLNPQNIAKQLTQAVEEARSIQDSRAESYALGQLGRLYEQTKQLNPAQKLTEEALLIAQSINAPDIAYGWQWQLGRLLQAQGETKGAIAAYDAAVITLESLRGDLVSVNPDVQFSFRETVEPVYRQLVSLLLQSKASTEEIQQARKVIESLQQAELVNFFREDCLTSTPIQIDEVDQKAAVIYPIVLPDRLEVVLSLPNAPLRHYATNLPQADVEKVFTQLRQVIAPFSVEPNRGLGIQDRERECRGLAVEGRECTPAPQQSFLPLAQQMYDWLIRPVEQELAASEAKTLVFVLDGPLLNLPMAVLHDGEQFLIEKYAIALTPGLQLLDPKPLARGKLTALKAGLTQAHDGFPALPFVEQELAEIKSEVPGELLLNENFTKAAIEKAMDSVAFPVVHLATHGQFSSNAEDTFILAWDQRLNVNQLNNLLRSREESGGGAIELLVLSACQTATGDKRAALGLAGVAVRAGARSTLATLWLVDDAATAQLMIRFYQELTDTKITKAEALRRAQMALLKNSQYQQPRFWAPFVLVGNWL